MRAFSLNLGWVGDWVWCSGSSSQLGILARLSVLDASIALSALLLLLQSSRTFLKFSLYFPYRWY